MSAIRGVQLLPPKISTSEALGLYKKIANINYIISKMNSEIKHSIVNTSLIKIMTLNESVQSTRIEGTQVTFTDIIEESTSKNKTSAVQEVENYNEALNYGINQIEQGYPITTKLIKEIHTILMNNGARGTISDKGEFRKIQNYIGPKGCTEETASYVPISASEIGNFMTNLEYFINKENHISFDKTSTKEEVILDENVDGLIKTAILHAQFESIHPFLDGNGRTGRILIVLNAIKDNLVDSPIFFVSEELEKEKIRYYNRLNGIRGNNPDWFAWIDFFLDACERMANGLVQKFDNIDKLARDGIKLLRDTDNGNVVHAWLYTFSKFSCTVKQVANAIEVSEATARKYLNILVEHKMVDVDNTKQRNKVYVNYDLLAIIN